MATKITAKMLESKSVCNRALRKFKRLYPTGIYITIKNVIELQKHFNQHDLWWPIDDFCTLHVANIFLEVTSATYTRSCTNKYFTLKEDQEEYARGFVKAWNAGRKKKRGKQV